MANQTTYDCDGCGSSIADPGAVTELNVTSYGLKDGTKYIDGSYHRDELELCPSCTANVKKVINRALPAANL